MRKATVFTIITCLFVLFPLTINSQPPPPRKKAPVQKPKLVLPDPRAGGMSERLEMVFTPDGQLFTVSFAQFPLPLRCTLWDLSNGKNLKTFTLPQSGGLEGRFGMVISADGQFLATRPRFKKSIRVWNLFTEKIIGDITTTSSFWSFDANPTSFSSDGQFLIEAELLGAGTDSLKNVLYFWDPHTRKSLHTYSYATNDPYFAVTPDGKFVAFHIYDGRQSGHIDVFDNRGKRLRKICQIKPSGNVHIRNFVFSPDRKSLAVVVGRRNRTTIELWNLKGTLWRSLKLSMGQHTNDIVFSPDGQMIAVPITAERGASKQTVQLWDTGTGKLIRTLSSPGGALSSVAFSPDGQGLVGVPPLYSEADKVPLWDPQTGKFIALLAHGAYNPEDGQEIPGMGISNMIFSPDGRFVAGTLHQIPREPGRTPVRLPLVWEIATSIERDNTRVEDEIEFYRQLKDPDSDGGGRWVDLEKHHPNRFPNLRTSYQGNETAIIFVNLTKAPITYYWIDGKGEDKYYGKIPAGASVNQHTYMGHFWLIKNARGGNLAVFRAESKTGRALLE